MKILPVIMSGGSGSRLWPKSRALYPKQFLALENQYSLLQNTLLRLEGLNELCDPMVITNQEHRFIVAEQLRAINSSTSAIILEPFGRNTAPAITLAALWSQQLYQKRDVILLVLCADHIIRDKAAFHQAINIAYQHGIENELVTFGIVPQYPETGYGYIKVDQGITHSSKLYDDAYKVEAFVEKPTAEKANEYFKSGNFYWNSGMFLFKASRFIQELEKFQPQILTTCKTAIHSIQQDLDFMRIDADVFHKCPDDSIDYAVMEKTEYTTVVPLNAGWSDVGSWESLADLGKKDEAGNNIAGDVLLHEVTNSYIKSENKLIATVGIDNLVIVESDDAFLVANKDKTQDVKKIVAQLKAKNRSEFKLHRKVERPWGTYDSIDSGPRFKVKRIRVKPGAKLSLQMHHHRAEHWIIVRGTALVTNDTNTILLSENQSTYIPIGVKHRLENPGKVELELIEVQTGEYLEEDDIVRFEDNYGRI